MNEEEVREKCVQLAEMAGGLAVEVKGLTIELELLKHYINNMCAMIECQAPLKEQDRWVEDCKAEGLYTGDL
tara:strand:+ start:381 stop:596 length:216 start_codon:yes stop_codon:yes gene_type:complete